MEKGHNSLFIEGCPKCYCKVIKIKVILKLRKYRQNGVEGMKVLMRILEEQRTRPDHNLTICDEIKFLSYHTAYINSILHHASSYYFLSHKKLFQAGNFNVNVRPDPLYFSIWGVYSKTYQKHNLWPIKTAKTLCTSSRRLVWWNVIHSTKISVVLLALKAKGQKILNAPRSCESAFKFLLRNVCVKGRKMKGLDACDMVEIWRLKMF